MQQIDVVVEHATIADDHRIALLGHHLFGDDRHLLADPAAGASPIGASHPAEAGSLAAEQPTGVPEAELRLLYEPDFDEYKLDGFISGPLTTTLSGRLSVRWRELDGYMTNLTINRTEAQREERAVRGTLSWSPTENLDVTLKLETGTFDVTGLHAEIVVDQPAIFGPFTGLTYAQILQLFGQDGSVANNFQDYRRSSGGDTSDNETGEYVLTLHVLGDEGRGVLFSSHILSDVERIADRVGILSEGSLVVDATLEELKQRVQVRHVRVAEGRMPDVPGLLRSRPVRDGVTEQR